MQANLVVLSGASADVPGQFGAASMTAAMLDEGAAGKAALALADEVEFLGAQLSTAASFDASAVRMSTPAAKLADALGLLADVALTPDFPPQELERLRTERLTALLQARDEPQSLAGIAFPRLLYGPEHRYGTGAGGTETSLKALGVDQLRTFHRGHYRPDNAVLIVVGDVDAAGAAPARRRALRRLEGRRPGRAAVSGAGRAAARQAPDLHRRQARRRAVADPHRAGRRAALDARLHRARRVEHHSRRLVHLAAQHQPAREERLRLRRGVALRHAPGGRAVLGRRRRADRQDRRGAEGVLQRAERHAAADSRPRSSRRPRTTRRCRSPASSRPPASWR